MGKLTAKDEDIYNVRLVAMTLSADNPPPHHHERTIGNCHFFKYTLI